MSKLPHTPEFRKKVSQKYHLLEKFLQSILDIKCKVYYTKNAKQTLHHNKLEVSF